MTKKELIDRIAAITYVSKTDAGEVLKALALVIADQLHEGATSEVPGIVKLYPTLRKARKARNPITGEAIDVPEKKVVKVKVLHLARKAVA